MLTIFTLLVFVSLAVGAYWLGGLGVTTQQTLASATYRSLIYVAVAVAFGLYLSIAYDGHVASLFFSGYLMEKALSVDNLMVFGAVFHHFAIPAEQQPRALRYGILGAVVMRLLFVVVGTMSLGLFGRPIEILMGCLIAWSAWKMIKGGDEPQFNRASWFGKLLPDSGVFWLSVAAIETTDLMFSFDSIPTVIAVSRDAIIIYPAMIFAILGLRSMYFILDAAQRALKYLSKAVIALLIFVAAKLILGLQIDAMVTLVIAVGTLSAGVIASLAHKQEGSTLNN